jgi:cytochrome c551/c552
MNIFDQLIIPPTADHTEMLNIFLVFSLLLFIPFSSILLGSSVFAYIFNFLGRKYDNGIYQRFAKDILDKLIISLSAGIGIVIVPVLSVTFVYAQMLWGANVISVGVLLLASIFYTAGVILLYRYKNSMNSISIVESFKKMAGKVKLSKDIQEYEETAKSIKKQSGFAGMFCLLCATFLFAGATTLSEDPLQWSVVTNILGLFVLSDVAINFIYLFLASLSISSAAILYFFFIWQGGIKNMDQDYRKLVLRFSVTTALLTTIFLPLFVIIEFVMTPQVAMSKAVFIYTGLALVAFLLTCNFLYAILKNSEVKYSAAAFFILILAFSFVIIKEQVTVANALQRHLITVNHVADSLEAAHFPKDTKVVGLTGEQLYSQKCSACHKFDQKVTGPPYDQTVPKYNGDVNKLAAFIFNPTKVDPGYPAMPNQGISMKEAQAVAQYLIDQVQKQTGK